MMIKIEQFSELEDMVTVFKRGNHSIKEIGMSEVPKGTMFHHVATRVACGRYQLIFSTVSVEFNIIDVVIYAKSDLSLQAVAESLNYPDLYKSGLTVRYKHHENGLVDNFIGEFIQGPYTNVRGRITQDWAATSIYGSR